MLFNEWTHFSTSALYTYPTELWIPHPIKFAYCKLVCAAGTLASPGKDGVKVTIS